MWRAQKGGTPQEGRFRRRTKVRSCSDPAIYFITSFGYGSEEPANGKEMARLGDDAERSPRVPAISPVRRSLSSVERRRAAMALEVTMHDVSKELHAEARDDPGDMA